MNFTPNWKRNKNPLTNKPFKDKYEALATAVGMVTKGGGTIMLNGEVYGWKK